MKYRLSKIYTRKGDEGYTSLADQRLSKDDLLVEAVGNLDELNAAIGLVLAMGVPNASIAGCLYQIQNDLFDMGGELHFPDNRKIAAEKITWLENQLDTWNKDLPPLTEFILPGGTNASAACHLARTVCRRTERSLVRLHRQISLHNMEMLRYLNRLSDLLFVISRVMMKIENKQETLWEHDR